MNKRAKYAIVCVILLISVAILAQIFFSISKKPGATIDFTGLGRLPGNASNSPVDLIKDNYYFSNGRALVKYNLTTDKSYRLTDSDALPSIFDISVSPDERYVLVRVSGDSLSTTSSSDTAAGFSWWLLNASTKKAVKVDSLSGKIVWTDQDKFAYMNNNQLLVENAVDGSKKEIYKNTEDVTLKDTLGKSFVLSKENGEIFLVDEAGKTSQLAEGRSGIDNFIASGSNDCYFFQYTLGGGNPNNTKTKGLIVCDKRKIKVSDAVGEGVFSSDNKYFFYNTDAEGPESKYVNLENGKTGSWGATTQQNDVTVPVIIFSQTKGLFSVGGDYYMTGKNRSAIRGNFSFSAGGLLIDMNQDSQSVVVSKDSDYTTTDKRKVQDTLKGKGIDPNLVQINYTIITTDDNRFN